MVSFEDFKKLELRIAKVVLAEKVEGADKLLRLVLDVGGKECQIVSGIAGHYLPEDLVGREIVVVVNLEPRILRGIESQGMLLAASDEEGRLALLTPDKEISSGAMVN